MKTIEKTTIESLSEKKRAEWRQWGKDGYKSTASMARTNKHHPDYDTPEKIEALHDNYGGSYLLTESRAEILKEKWGYSDNAVIEAVEAYKEGYNASRTWYKGADEKYKKIIAKYQPIFDEAEKVAKKVDVSDIKDGFPCGSAYLYLQRYAEAEDLYKALGHFNSSSTDAYKYALPIKMPSYGQCVSFDERICKEVNEFLRSRGVFASVYSWID